MFGKKFFIALAVMALVTTQLGCAWLFGRIPTNEEAQAACKDKPAGTIVTLGSGLQTIPYTCGGAQLAQPTQPPTRTPRPTFTPRPTVTHAPESTLSVLFTNAVETLQAMDSMPTGTGQCEDGKLVLSYNAEAGQTLDRTPIGEAERVDILEISYEGEGLGFGSHARAIIVIPRLGPVWMVDAIAGSDSIATRGFCGTNEVVAAWAVSEHIPSLQQASRDANGDQPPAAEIAVYRLDFEARAMYIVKTATATNAPTPEEVLSWIEVMFHEGNNINSVPMHVQR